MNDTERKDLNKRIALRLGYTYENGLWNAPEGEPLYGLKDPPDFTREWNHAGPLLVELFKDDAELALDEILLVQEQDECDLIEAVAVVWDTWEEAKQ